MPPALTGVRVSQGNQLLGRPLFHLPHPLCLKETGTFTELVAGSTTGVCVCVCVYVCVCVCVCVRITYPASPKH